MMLPKPSTNAGTPSAFSVSHMKAAGPSSWNGTAGRRQSPPRISKARFSVSFICMASKPLQSGVIGGARRRERMYVQRNRRAARVSTFRAGIDVCPGLAGRSALGEDWAAAALAGVRSFVGAGLDLSGGEPYSFHRRELPVGLFGFTQWKRRNPYPRHHRPLRRRRIPAICEPCWKPRKRPMSARRR